MRGEDRDLREALGAPEAPEPPSFGSMWAAARREQGVRARRRRAGRWAGGVAVAALAGALWWGPGGPPAGAPELDPELAESLSGWRAPLDFLLTPPGAGPRERPELPGEGAERVLTRLAHDLEVLGETP